MANPKESPRDLILAVDTPEFRIFKEKKGAIKPDHPLMIIGPDEEVYEIRQYGSRPTSPTGYELRIVSKKKGDQYWLACKGIRPSKVVFVTTMSKGPMSREDYDKFIAMMESHFASLFDVENVRIIPGKHINLYFKS